VLEESPVAQPRSYNARKDHLTCFFFSSYLEEDGARISKFYNETEEEIHLSSQVQGNSEESRRIRQGLYLPENEGNKAEREIRA